RCRRASPDALRHPLPRADGARRRASARPQPVGRGRGVEGRHRLPAPDRARAGLAQLRRRGGAAGGRPAAGRRPGAGAARRARSRSGTGGPAAPRRGAAALALRGAGGAPQAGACGRRARAAHPPGGAGAPRSLGRRGTAGDVSTRSRAQGTAAQRPVRRGVATTDVKVLTAPSVPAHQHAGREEGSMRRWVLGGELFPAPLNVIPLKVSPGDTVSAEVSASGTAFTLTITVGTQQFSTTQTSADAAKSSAEWIAEGPSRFLADFNAVSFFDASAAGS